MPWEFMTTNRSINFACGLPCNFITGSKLNGHRPQTSEWDQSMFSYNRDDKRVNLPDNIVDDGTVLDCE